MSAPPYEAKLKDLMKVFLEENTKLNLSAFRTEETCWNGNILDSVAGVDAIKNLHGNEPLNILDIGTGGGFPLLPLAICLPHCAFTGVDSTKKKLDAIQRIVDALDLTNVTLVCGRTEELGHDPAYREQFDIVTARAVASLNVLLEYAAPFAKVKGHLLLWKSMTMDQELQDSLLARTELSCTLKEHIPYDLPEGWGTRQLLLFEKRTETKDTYPRGVGVPGKEPLL